MVLTKKFDKFIEKGGYVQADKEQKDWHRFTLRIPNEMVKAIEKKLKVTVGLNKTGFILQAIQEKLNEFNE
jgi:hypothetical protein